MCVCVCVLGLTVTCITYIRGKLMTVIMIVMIIIVTIMIIRTTIIIMITIIIIMHDLTGTVSSTLYKLGYNIV